MTLWWRMAAGGQHVARQRRHHDKLTSSYRVCATHCDALETRTHTRTWSYYTNSAPGTNHYGNGFTKCNASPRWVTARPTLQH